MKNKSTSVIFRLARYAARHKVSLIAGLGFIALGSVLSLFVPLLVARAIDTIVITADGVYVDGAAIARYAAFAATSAALSGFFIWLSNLLLSGAAIRMTKDVRSELFGKLLTVSMAKLDRYSRGDLMARMTAFGESLSDGVYQGVMQLSSGVVTLAVTIILMFTLNWAVSLVVIALSPVSAIVSYKLAKRNRVTFKRQSENISEMSGLAEEYIAGNRVTRAYGRRLAAEADFSIINKKLYESGLSSQFAGALVNPVSRIVNNVIYAAVAVVGCLLTGFYLSGDIGMSMTVGALSAFLAYATQFAKPFNDVTSVTAELQTAAASARSIFEIIDISDDGIGGDVNVCPPISGIEFIGGEFSYDGKPFIRDLDFSVERGQRVAIVGTTGSGKTTVINLIMRFYDLSSGKCIFDGRNIEQYRRASVRRHIGMVLQDTWLFEGTIRENIAYGKPDASDEEIAAAARAAHLDGFIGTLKNGYDTVISGDAEELSEGQKQLITIARIFLTSPEILILDEATASVDALTETAVQAAFAEVLDGKTTITVAHRLSTVRNSDIIYVMDGGKIAERGTHENLAASGGIYSRMLAASGLALSSH